jgi:hypothetical protein
MFTIGKYEFNSKEQAKDKIKSLGLEIDEQGNEYPTHNHSIVELGHIVLKQGVYDEDLNEIEAPIFSDKYSVDVMWDGLDAHPYGWASYAIDLEDNGVHSFLGVNYLKYKIK